MSEKEDKSEVEENIKIKTPKTMSFFKRMYISIFKVERYGEFILEKSSFAIKYFFKLMLIVSLIVSLAITIKMHTIINKGYMYLKNEMPNFNLSEGKMVFDIDTEAYDKDMDLYVLYATKTELSDNEISKIEKQIQKYSTSIVYLQDRIIYYNGEDYSYFKYSDLIKQYDLQITNKQDVEMLANRIGVKGFDIVYFLATLISGYIINIVTVILDVILIFCFAVISSRFCGVNMPASKMFSLSIYSLTLSVLLSAIYTMVYTFTDFYIDSFQTVYILIAYIYIIAAILIIKSDVIKQKMELQKIITVQKQVKKELEEEKEKQKEEEKDKDKENDNKKDDRDENKKEEDPILDREPDGSEI